MAREIKFRVYVRETNKMLAVQSINWGFKGDGKTITVQEVREDGFFREHVVGESCDLTQFTGLLDRHGKEIYEGDIVKTAPVYPAVLGALYPQDTFEVTWHDYYWELKGMTGGVGLGENGILEVIGNVHENQLLTEQPHGTG